MKELKEYTKENINESSIKDWLRNFWGWLTGKVKKEFDPSSEYYDEKEKMKYINQYTSDAILIKEINDSKKLKAIISKSISEDNQKIGFYRIKEDFKKHPEHEQVNENYKWLTLIFKSDNLIESCALIGITYKDNNSPKTPVVFIFEDLDVYKNIINYGDIVKSLKEIDSNIIIKDSRLISQLNKNEIDIEPYKDIKGYYTII